MQHTKIAVLTAAGALAVPAAAQAHVTLQPKTAVAGAYTVLDVRVPNERDNASTVKVDVQFPDGFPAASYQPIAGWKVKVIRKKLAKPIQTDDGPITEGIDRMIWTGSKRTGLGKIGPGEFMDLPISVQIPGKAGDTLTFKALQTYTNGEIVRWIGAPTSDTPAPQVKVTAASASSATQAGAPAPASSDGGRDGGPSAWSFVVAGLGLLIGVGAVAMTRVRGVGPVRGASR